MTTHLYPGAQSSGFRKHNFKPKINADRPIVQSSSMPAIRGSCSSSRSVGSQVRFGDANSPSSYRSGTFGRSSLGADGNGGFGDDSSSSLREKAELLLASISEEEERLQRQNMKDVGTRIGMALEKWGSNISELVKQWDKNGKADLSRLEFRQGLRQPSPFGLGLEDLEFKEVDSIFDAHDSDGSGTLEMKEITAVLKAMQRSAKVANDATDELKSRTTKLKAMVQYALEAAGAAEAAEVAEEHLKAKQTDRSAAEQLGTQIIKKQIKIVRCHDSLGTHSTPFTCILTFPPRISQHTHNHCIVRLFVQVDILIKWDSNGDGDVSKAEFRTHCKSLGVTAPPAELDELFDKYDSGKSGDLKISDLKLILRDLTGAAKTMAAEEGRLEKTATYLRKIARKLLLIFKSAYAPEARARQEAEAAVAAAEALRTAREQATRQREEAKRAAEEQARQQVLVIQAERRDALAQRMVALTEEHSSTAELAEEAKDYDTASVDEPPVRAGQW